MWASEEINEIVKIKEIFSFFEQDCSKTYDFKGEQHNFWECLYVKKGMLCVSADERIYRLNENQMIFHKPMEYHKFYVDCTEGAKIFVFSFSLEGELTQFFKNKVFTLSKEQKQIIDALLDYAHKKLASVDIPPDTSLYEKYRYPFTTIKTYPQMLITYIYQLLLSLADNGEVSDRYHTDESDAFKKAVKYMNANVGKLLSVKKIANFCNVSDTTLKRIFARYTGIGIHKYFVQLKMKHAAELLQNGETVSRTAEKLGFSSQAYFSAAFKRETGTSPSYIRNSEQK